MMTPLEKAVEASMSAFDGFYSLTDDDVRAIIRAFLEAVAEDERVLKAAYLAYSDADAETCVQDMAAAILALKETING